MLQCPFIEKKQKNNLTNKHKNSPSLLHLEILIILICDVNLLGDWFTWRLHFIESVGHPNLSHLPRLNFQVSPPISQLHSSRASILSLQCNVILQPAKPVIKCCTPQAKWVGLNWISDSFRQDSDVYVYQYLQRVGKCSGEFKAAIWVSGDGNTR